MELKEMIDNNPNKWIIIFLLQNIKMLEKYT